MGSDAFMQLMQSRFAARGFSDEQLSEQELAQILEAGRLSPSAKNNQPTRLCVVQSPEGLSKADECSPCCYGAPTVIIAAYDRRESFKGLGLESGDFGDVDTSIALTNMEMQAVSLGLRCCWVGNFDAAAVREHFAVPEEYQLVELLMIGHASVGPSPRHYERKTLSDFVSYESF